MEGKHSKTPWKLVKHKDQFGNLCFYSIISQDRSTVAEIFIHEGLQVDQEIHNAYLIAASPKLLEVLELVQSWLLATGQVNDMLGIISYTLLEARGKIGIDSSKEGLL